MMAQPKYCGGLRAADRDSTRGPAKPPVANADEFVNGGRRVAPLPMPSEPFRQGLDQCKILLDKFVANHLGFRLVPGLVRLASRNISSAFFRAK